MKPFLDEDFLLSNETAKKLYHDHAEKMPIIDYHCHIDPKEIWEDRKFETITQVWLGGDHYKWRQMRSNGIDEKYITGNASDYEKFEKWAETLPKAIGNPLYHWSHLELKRYFGFAGHLTGKNAKEVFELANAKLASPDMSAREIVKKSNVKLICTTDDPVDSLEYHEKIAADTSFDTKVIPAWRPDKAMNLEKEDFLAYIDTLSKVSDTEITDFKSLIEALAKRMDYFVDHGCLLSDHGIKYVAYVKADEARVDEILKKRLTGETVNSEEEGIFKTAFLLAMAREYYKRNWVMQLHYGCIRDNNTRMFKALGADTGFDAISNHAPAAELSAFLDDLAKTDELPKTILYSLNPADNALIDTLIGCFQCGPTAGKIQHGSAWWFNDHKAGMTDQMTSLANLGLLGNFIGMLTDSRSFLSYTRHEYFRRIMCNLIGTWVENGEYPNDEEVLGKMVEDISFNNTVNYFGFKL